MVPDSSTASPGRTWAEPRVTPGSSRPMPEVLTNRPSAEPRPTTLVSPVTMWTSARAAARRADSMTRPSWLSGRPSSMMNASDRTSGRAPPMARSLTVPLTASSPMSPPGKNSGVTTYESVVKATRTSGASGPPTGTTAWSSSSARAGLDSAGSTISSINWAVRRPPRAVAHQHAVGAGERHRAAGAQQAKRQRTSSSPSATWTWSQMRCKSRV